MESDIVSDDVLDTHTFRINDLEIDTLCEQTFKFGEVSLFAHIVSHVTTVHKSGTHLRHKHKHKNIRKRRQYLY
jgi:hypothetical protein